MRKLALALIVTLAFSATATALEIAISTQANWWSQTAADAEMQEIVDNVTAVPVLLFPATEQIALADWVADHTGDGVSDLLILCGQCPDTIYAPGNTQPDGSLLELFLDDGNCIINTGDWIFYVVNGGGTNGTAALPNVMDITNMDMWDDNTPVTVTAEGRLYTPSLTNFQTDRGIHLDLLENDWYAELILALAADGNRADPIIVRNSVTGGRIGIFFQTAGQDNDPRGEVMSEWINNWYLKVVADPALAGSPNPDKEAIDVPRDVTLTWSPGQSAATHDVYLGTVFDDVNDASRANPMGVLVSQGQGAAAYQPADILDFETTYYWRVDEVNGAPDNTVFKGEVWSFTTEPFAYPIANVTATSNGTSEAEAGAGKTVNGSGLNADDQHSTESEDMWVATPGADPLYIQFEFDQVYKLHQMLVWNYNVQFELLLGFGIKDVTVEYSENGTDWTALGDVELARGTARANYVANTTIDFGGVAARYVRLMVNTGYGMMGQYGLSEVRFMYIPAQAREPEPGDAATNVSVGTSLTWRAGRDAVSHEVALGTDPEALLVVETVDGTSYVPGALDLATTYYWQITAVQEAESWTGAVWSFATQEYLVVDDFESYDNEDNRIYDTWLDGWVNDTGSTVGYLEEPFAETSIVHGGRQSMPLMYDNGGGATTSEAEYTFDAPQNWTGNGIQSLALSFRGETTNSGGQLYLKINNTKIPYDGDAGDLSQALWHAWNIDLSAVPGNLQSVTMLTIGVEGAGTQGMLYIDDVSLYPRAVEYITPAEPDSANLVGRWSLDGNANDSSGNGYNGAETNGPTYVSGIDGQAMKFDGVDDYVDIADTADWPSGAEPRTMSFWARTNSVEAGYRFAVSYGTEGTGRAMFIGINGTTLYGGGYGDDVTVTDFWVMGEWHHLALTYDGTTARLYAEGVEVVSAPKNWNLVLGRAHIGQQVNNFSEFWNGTVDEVRIYRSALSADEVAWLAGRNVPIHKPF